MELAGEVDAMLVEDLLSQLPRIRCLLGFRVLGSSSKAYRFYWLIRYLELVRQQMVGSTPCAKAMERVGLSGPTRAIV